MFASSSTLILYEWSAAKFSWCPTSLCTPRPFFLLAPLHIARVFSRSKAAITFPWRSQVKYWKIICFWQILSRKDQYSWISLETVQILLKSSGGFMVLMDVCKETWNYWKMRSMGHWTGLSEEQLENSILVRLAPDEAKSLVFGGGVLSGTWIGRYKDFFEICSSLDTVELIWIIASHFKLLLWCFVDCFACLQEPPTRLSTSVSILFPPTVCYSPPSYSWKEQEECF